MAVEANVQWMACREDFDEPVEIRLDAVQPQSSPPSAVVSTGSPASPTVVTTQSGSTHSLSPPTRAAEEAVADGQGTSTLVDSLVSQLARNAGSVGQYLEQQKPEERPGFGSALLPSVEDATPLDRMKAAIGVGGGTHVGATNAAVALVESVKGPSKMTALDRLRARVAAKAELEYMRRQCVPILPVADACL
jgi:hypothetical protein